MTSLVQVSHLFKTGIQPIWEDEANRRGGKWIVRIPKGLAGYYWERVVLSIIGEQFDVGNEICGAVLSVRFNVPHIFHEWSYELVVPLLKSAPTAQSD